MVEVEGVWLRSERLYLMGDKVILMISIYRKKGCVYTDKDALTLNMQIVSISVRHHSRYVIRIA